MEFIANGGKKVRITVNGEVYLRHAIKTHFVKPNEEYIDVIRKYLTGIYREGDILSISEKIIAICQGRIVKREDLKISGLCKLFGVKGVFYRIVGREVAGLDGFYDGAWEEYRDIGIEIPSDPCGVCREIRDKLGISCIIVDANDFGQVILGKSDDIEYDEEALAAMIRDNPAGQRRECTPLILIRKDK